MAPYGRHRHMPEARLGQTRGSETVAVKRRDLRDRDPRATGVLAQFHLHGPAALSQIRQVGHGASSSLPAPEGHLQPTCGWPWRAARPDARRASARKIHWPATVWWDEYEAWQSATFRLVTRRRASRAPLRRLAWTADKCSGGSSPAETDLANKENTSASSPAFIDRPINSGSCLKPVAGAWRLD